MPCKSCALIQLIECNSMRCKLSIFGLGHRSLGQGGRMYCTAQHWNARNGPQRDTLPHHTLTHKHNRARNKGRCPSHVPVLGGRTHRKDSCVAEMITRDHAETTSLPHHLTATRTCSYTNPLPYYYTTTNILTLALFVSAALSPGYFFTSTLNFTLNSPLALSLILHKLYHELNLEVYLKLYF